MLRHVMAGVSGPGSARHGAVCFGRHGTARRGMVGLGKARFGKVCYGGRGTERQGQVRRVQVR